MIESTTRHGARRYTELPNANNKIKRIGGGREREKRGPKLKRGAVSKERKERKEGRKKTREWREGKRSKQRGKRRKTKSKGAKEQSGRKREDEQGAREGTQEKTGARGCPG